MVLVRPLLSLLLGLPVETRHLSEASRRPSSSSTSAQRQRQTGIGESLNALYEALKNQEGAVREHALASAIMKKWALALRREAR